MSDIKQLKMDDIPSKHKCVHDDYEYYKRDFIPKGYANQCAVSIYEIPPLKSAYPYHYHYKNEEVFYILSGEGILKTPEGEKIVTAGDFIFLPASSNGAHKMTNTSESEHLTYIDFDTVNDIDVAIYPDSKKIGIWGKGINRVYKMDEDVDYYDGE